MKRWKHLQITQIPHNFQIRNWKTDSKGRILKIVMGIILRHATFHYKATVLSWELLGVGILSSRYSVCSN